MECSIYSLFLWPISLFLLTSSSLNLHCQAFKSFQKERAFVSISNLKAFSAAAASEGDQQGDNEVTHGLKIPKSEVYYLEVDELSYQKTHQWRGLKNTFGCIFEYHDIKPYRLFTIPIYGEGNGDGTQRLRLRELTHEEGGYGSRVWIAALCMSSWMGQNNHLFQGKTVLELGSGCGLPGILAAKLGASKVALTDFASGDERARRRRNRGTVFLPPPDLLANLGYNAALCRADDVTEVQNLDWLECLSKSFQPKQQYDWVLAAACIYNKSDAPALAAAIRKHLKPGGKLLMVHQKSRRERGLIELVEELKAGQDGKDRLEKLVEDYLFLDSPPLFENEPLIMHIFQK
uniref:Calmodulin-lysine N-methyltransferase n=1 Tax=Heterosigma akashiwo TaxID=2829 RepID=A0A7S3UR78_HETAK